MPTLFSKIIKGEIPSYKIGENESSYAFLDISPLAEGHTLVVPKLEVDYIFDLDDSRFTALTLFAKQVALAIGKAVPCLRVGVAVVGLEVPHAHIHLIPLKGIQDIDFSRPKLKLEQEKMEAIASKIKANLERKM